MITIEGRPHRLCGGLTRRDTLRIGTLGIAGFALADLLQLKAEAAPTRGRAKSIIMVHLSGGPSHIDTYDPKPDAPAEYRGDFKAIPTNVDGCQIGELFPLQAKQMDRLAVIRSVSRVVPEEHASSLMCTGYTNTERKAQGDRPSIGAVVSKLYGHPESLIPPYVSLRGVDSETGLGAAYLGANNEPLWVGGPGKQDLRLRFSMDRLKGRRKLLDQINGFRRQVEAGAVQAQDDFSQRALEIVSSSATYNALDASKEDKKVRERYGKDQFLVARRLVEAGVQCVALEVGGWDTHSDNFKSLRNLMPPLDKAFTALLDDLHASGKIQDTVVVMWGEFGRTPKVNGTAGRDHWPSVMSAVVAGGGLKMGQVIGATDSNGSEAVESPVKVRHVVATLYHALGIDPSMNLIDKQDRPIPLIHDAQPIPALTG
jgi:uncharacterized protein (DUF1501 family)